MADLREMRRQRDRAVKIPAARRAPRPRPKSLAQPVWVQARQDDDWASFAPHLARLLDLKQQEAEAVGYETEAYDALVDEYEPGARVAELTELFGTLRRQLSALIAERRQAPRPPQPDLLRQEFDLAAQDTLSRQVLADIGFDFASGRLDVSTHPFTRGSPPATSA